MDFLAPGRFRRRFRVLFATGLCALAFFLTPVPPCVAAGTGSPVVATTDIETALTPGSIAAESDELFTGSESDSARQRDYDLLRRGIAQHPGAYELLWRGGRAAWAIGDRLDDERDSARLKKMGEEAMAWTEQAVSVNPEGIEGRFYHGLAISVYSRGISLVRAIFKGLAGKYEDDMNFVIGNDRNWQQGAAPRALGRYYYQIPWPKRDLAKSDYWLRESFKASPRNFRTHLYLADTLAALKRTSEARAEYRFVLEESPAPSDLNEIETLRAAARKGAEALPKD